MQLTLRLEDLASIVAIASPLATGLFMAVDWMIKRRLAEFEVRIGERITRVETLLEECRGRLDRLEQRVDELGKRVYGLQSGTRVESDDPPGGGGRREWRRRLYELLASLMGALSLSFVLMDALLAFVLVYAAVRRPSAAPSTRSTRR